MKVLTRRDEFVDAVERMMRLVMPKYAVTLNQLQMQLQGLSEDHISDARALIAECFDRVAERKSVCVANACHRRIWFFKTAKSQGTREMPFSEQALPHFADCADPERFRRKAKAEVVR